MTVRAAPAPSLFGWRRGTAYALLLGATMCALEAVVPLGFADPRGYGVRQLLASVPGWSISSAAIVVFTAWAVPRLSLQALVPAFVAAVLAATALQASLPRDHMINTNAGYLGWALTLYGLLFVGANVLAFRAERTRALLVRAELARSRSEALFDEAELASLQGVVEPVFVLRVLEQLQRRYAADGAAADRLLGQLVDFLRHAMPAVRSGRSTLGAELALVRSYMHLCSAVDAQRAGWHCEIAAALDDVPFPPLLLLPLLDALAAQAPAAARALCIRARDDGRTVELRLEAAAPAGRLPPLLLHRLRVGLQALHGPAVHVGAVPGAPLTIEFPRADAAPMSHPPSPGAPPP